MGMYYVKGLNQGKLKHNNQTIGKVSFIFLLFIVIKLNRFVST